MTRFRKVEKPEAIPFRDIHDQDSSNPVWDMGVDLEAFSGSIYIKEHYILEIARLAGMVPEEKYKKLLEENEILRKKVEITASVEEIPVKMGELQSELNLYLAAYRSESVDSEPVNSGSDSIPEDSEIEGDLDLDFSEGSKLS